jgi:hypothetical protein
VPPGHRSRWCAGVLRNTATVSGGGEVDTGNNSALDSGVVETRTLLPPLAAKSVREVAPGVYEWRIVLINRDNPVPVTVRIEDPLRRETPFVPGSLSCRPSGTTSVSRCTYDASGIVTVDARLGADVGRSDEAGAEHELVVVFQVELVVAIRSVSNEAEVGWDANSTGTVDDDPAAITVRGWMPITPAIGIPVDARWMLAGAMLMLLVFARRELRRANARTGAEATP